MHYSPYKLALVLITALLLTTSLMAANKPPRPISVTDIPASNAAEIGATKNAEMIYKQAAIKADAAMKRTRAEGGEWREIADLLMQSSVTSRTGDFQTATKMANQAQLMAEESYDAVIAARKAEAERKAAEARRAAAAKKAAEEKAAAARKAAANKKGTAQATPAKK